MAGQSDHFPSFVRDDQAQRDSEDRISFDAIARLVKPSAPPSPYASSSASARRSLGFYVLTAVLAVAAGVGLAVVRSMPGDGAEEPPARAPKPMAAPAAAATVEHEAVDKRKGAILLPEGKTRLVASAKEAAPAEEIRPTEPVRAHEAASRSRSPARSERANETDERPRRAPAVAAHSEAAPVIETAPESAAESAAASAPEAASAAEAASASEAASAPEAAPEDLRAAPSREEVQRALDAVRPGVAECAAGAPGLVTVEVTVGSSGRVRSALVHGVFAGTPEGSCMARAVRRARFPRFTDESVTIRYPYRL